MDCSPADLHRARTAAERACRHLVHSREDAEDCASEAITWALSHPESLHGVANIEGWLVTVARRKAIDLARDAGRQRRCEGRLQAWEELPQHDHAEDIADQHEAAWVARRAEAALPHRTHSVMSALSRGESVVEAAESLRLTPRAVESHVLRARRRMRSILSIASGIAAVLAGAVRRGAPVAVPVTAVAFSVAVIVGGGGSGPAATPAVPRHQGALAVADSQAAGVDPAAHAAQEQAVTGPARPVVPHGAATAAPPVAKVATPAGHAKVESEDRGGDSGAVAAVMGCIDNLTVTPDLIGC